MAREQWSGRPGSTGTLSVLRLRDALHFRICKQRMERATGVEPATSSLGTNRSREIQGTTETNRAELLDFSINVIRFRPPFPPISRGIV